MAKAKKEFKVGETFQFGFIKLKCEKAKDEKKLCTGCVFKHTNCLYTQHFTGSCQDALREDKTDVIFVKVEE